MSKGETKISGPDSGSMSNAGPGVCKFCGESCKSGNRCRFSHRSLNPKDDRCFGCSAVGHSKRDCPHLKKKIARAKSRGASKRDPEESNAGGKGVDGKGTPKRPPQLPSEVDTAP